MSEIFFEQYIMALNWETYDIEVINDDAIKRDQIFFDLMQRTSNRMDGLYIRERFILIYTIIKYVILI